MHFSRRRVWCIWPSLLQFYKYGGGFLISEAVEQVTLQEDMLGPHSQWGLKKYNLFADEEGVFGLVYYRNTSMEVAV